MDVIFISISIIFQYSSLVLFILEHIQNFLPLKVIPNDFEIIYIIIISTLINFILSCISVWCLIHFRLHKDGKEVKMAAPPDCKSMEVAI